jgi:hypothetical protein
MQAPQNLTLERLAAAAQRRVGASGKPNGDDELEQPAKRQNLMTH